MTYYCSGCGQHKQSIAKTTKTGKPVCAVCAEKIQKRTTANSNRHVKRATSLLRENVDKYIRALNID